MNVNETLIFKSCCWIKLKVKFYLIFYYVYKNI